MTIMPFDRETEATVAVSSVAATTAYGSEYMTGFVDSIYVAFNATGSSTDTIVKITSSSTANLLFTVVNPSTAGLFYRPRAVAVLGGSTIAIATHGTSTLVPMSVFKERMMVHVSASTDNAPTGTGSVTVRMRVNPLY